MMKVSFLIVNFNGEGYVSNCIESIVNFASGVEYEIICIDNYSSDNSVVTIENRFPDVKLIRNERNVGFSKAMNQGYRASRGEYLFSFNPDAELMQDCIQRLVSHMDARPGVGKIGTATVDDGQILFPETQFSKWNGLQAIKIIRNKMFPGHRSERSAHVNGETVSWLFGTGILIRRAALSSPDFMYPEKSFLFWEEYWLSRQIKKNGYSITFLDNAKIIHHASLTFKTNKGKLKMARLLSLAHEYQIRKIEYGVINAVGNLLTICVDQGLLFIFFAPKILWKRKDIDLYNTVMDYYARSISAFRILLMSKSRIDYIDREVEEFFNR